MTLNSSAQKELFPLGDPWQIISTCRQFFTITRLSHFYFYFSRNHSRSASLASTLWQIEDFTRMTFSEADDGNWKRAHTHSSSIQVSLARQTQSIIEGGGLNFIPMPLDTMLHTFWFNLLHWVASHFSSVAKAFVGFPFRISAMNKMRLGW